MTRGPAVHTPAAERRRVEVDGIVQGVGFRPFVHRLASELRLTGWVRNDAGSVVVEVEGPTDDLDAFEGRLTTDAPPLATVVRLRVTMTCEPVGSTHFEIAPSTSTTRPVPTAPPDTAMCDACMNELRDPTDRRHRHPFITCTDCGPRFTIITSLPYDRPTTTMSAFTMCDACHDEYVDTDDRRFHAQPIACHDCGPVLRWEGPNGDALTGRGRDVSDDVLRAARRALLDGAILAVKGIGGWHLACRADDESAVQRLRARKHRPAKPLALLAADLDAARTVAEVTDEEAHELTGRAAPIVLLRRRAGASVAPAVAPGHPFLGVQLASNPLHHLLLAPDGDESLPLLVLTSGNRAEEPICTDDAEARERLDDLADAWLGHNRPIAVPCDDSVVRVLDDGPSVVRRSRGYVPAPVVLPVTGQPALALGGELKATTCLTDGRLAWPSQHIGDMGGLPALRALETTVARTAALHDLRPATLVVDAHPAATSARWADRRDEGATVLRVQHHHAHVAALLAEHGRSGPVLGVAFDGTGYGTDGTIWGGELLVADLLAADRVAHLSPVPLPGGDAAVRHPRRVALSHLRAAGLGWDDDLAPVAATPDNERRLLAAQLERGVAQVPTTSMGRLFDAVSSLLGVRHDISYEAQAAIELELLAAEHERTGGSATPLTLPLSPASGPRPGLLVCEDLVRQIVTGLRAGTAPAALALGFHHAVAAAVATTASRIADGGGPDTVGLTGGVFANALLVRLTAGALTARGLTVLRHRVVPTNDGGLALGQAAIAVARSAAPAHGHLD